LKTQETTNSELQATEAQKIRNEENKPTWEISPEKKDFLFMENKDKAGSFLQDKKKLIGMPILGITFAELLIYSGNIKEAVLLHVLLLLTLSLSDMAIKDEQVQKNYQALILLPILRLVNLSMPIFFDTTLYSFIFIYAPLIIPVTIAAKHQKIKREEIGLNFDKKLCYYTALAIPLGFLLGVGEYATIRTGYLIPELSFLNLLKLTIVMVFFVGLIEEIIFRAMLQTRLAETFGTFEGLFGASLLFGLMHSGYGTFYEILYTSFVGFIIGILFYKTKNLPFITVLHGFVNVFLFGIIPHMNLL